MYANHSVEARREGEVVEGGRSVRLYGEGVGPTRVAAS